MLDLDQNVSIVSHSDPHIKKSNIPSYFSADDYSKGYFKSLASVDYTGNVFWPPPTKFRSTCPVDVTYFPFDDQTCNLKLSSWMYDGTKVSGYWEEQYQTMWYSWNTNTVYFHIVRSGPSSFRRVWFSACHGLYLACQTCLCLLMLFHMCAHILLRTSLDITC